MKNLRFILIAAFSLLLTATSCKKEKQPEPAPAAPASVVTYGTFNVTIGCADVTTSGWPGTYSSATIKAYSRCGTTVLDSLIGIPKTNDPIGQDPCVVPFLATVSKSFITQDGSTNYIDIYEGSVLLVTAKLINSPSQNIYVTYLGPSMDCYNILSCPTLIAPRK